jgi:hypothetical protein
MGIFIVEGPWQHHHDPSAIAGNVSSSALSSVHVAVPGVVSAMAAGFSISTDVAEMYLVMSHVPTLAAFVAPVIFRKCPGDVVAKPVSPVMTERPPVDVVDGAAIVNATVAVCAPT